MKRWIPLVGCYFYVMVLPTIKSGTFFFFSTIKDALDFIHPMILIMGLVGSFGFPNIIFKTEYDL